MKEAVNLQTRHLSHRLLTALMGATLLSGVGYTQTPAAPTVTVVEAQIGRLEATRETSVVIRPEQVTEVAAGTSGRVLAISRRQDMPVTAGEVIVNLDTQQQQLLLQNATLALSSAQISLSSAQTANAGQQQQSELALRSAQASYNAAQQQFVEGRDLFNIGAISRVALSRLEAAALNAEAALTRAQGTLAVAQNGGGGSLELLQLQVEQAENQVAQAQQAITEASITSPLTGKITALLVEQGSFVNEGTPVFRVATTNQQLATFSVPLEVANRLSARGTLEIPYSGSRYAAQILSTSALNPTTQLVDVTARLQSSQTPIPNGTVTQFSYSYGGSGGIILPSDAVQLEPGRRFVFVYQDGRAVRRVVELIGESGDQVAVLGVDAGADVIYPVPSGLQDGQTVALAESN